MRIGRQLSGPARLTRRLMWRCGLRATKPWYGRAIALHDFEAVCYLVPKVACSSLTAICVDLLGFKLPEDAWKPAVFRDSSHDHLIDRRKRDAAKIDLAQAKKLSAYWRFAFVRDPYDRLVSCYSEKIRSDGPERLFVNGVHRGLLRYGRFKYGMSFAEFAREVSRIPDADADPHFRSQSSFLVDGKGELVVDFVGRFESLQEDLSRVASKLNVEMELPHLLKSKRDGAAAYYDPITRALVWERYAEDFRLLGYSA